MNFRILFLTLTLFVPAVAGRAQTRISLMTCGTGEPMYALFGHAAIRVQDSLRGTDQVYNYGVFDFDTPNFTMKFMRGKLMYKLDIQEFRYFLPEYRSEGRSVTEQELLLNEADEQAVIAYLTNNYQPEKRYYLYDFFFDNCATRIRDVFENVLEDRLEYRFPGNPSPPSFREAIDPYIGHNPWLDMGIDLLLGAPTDRAADERGLMFLPDSLSSNLGYAWVDGQEKLLGPKITHLEADPELKPQIKFEPVWLFLAILAIFVIIRRFLPHSRLLKIMDVGFWAVAGLAGCLVAFMWWGTDHVATKWNWNILWLHPVQLFVAVGLAVAPKAKWLKVFGWVQLVLAIGLAIGRRFLPMEVVPAQALSLLLFVAFQSLHLFYTRQRRV